MSTIHLRYFKIRDAHPAGPAGFQNVVESNNWARNYLGVSRLTNISVTNTLLENDWIYFSFFSSLSLTSSIYALMFHSIERYVVISNPLKYRTGPVISTRIDFKLDVDDITTKMPQSNRRKLLESAISVRKEWQNTCYVLLGLFQFSLHRFISLFLRRLIRNSYESTK